MQKKKIYLIRTMFFFAMMIAGKTAWALTQPLIPITPSIPDLPTFIHTLLTLAIQIGIPFSAVSFIWVGFTFVTANGDEGKITKAKEAFTWTVIGTMILVGAWALATAIQGTIESLK